MGRYRHDGEHRLVLLTQGGDQFVCERLIVNVPLQPDAKYPLNLVSDGTVTDEGKNCKILGNNQQI